ncbi:MAG: sodium/glutamate symporter [Rhodospirillales bacterium]|nr:sodium/glutamate symporter [Rhodospirillales bacterium]
MAPPKRTVVMVLEIEVFGTTTIAMCVFFLGYALVRRFAVLRDYAIPEPIVGGFAFAILIAVLYWLTDVKIIFDHLRRDVLLVYFFAALGMRTNIREVISYGRPLFILVALASVFILLQNLVGITIADGFGLSPAHGIITGSMALIGRSGTTIAWAPFFQTRFDLEHVSRLGLAANMSGLIAACALGGPLARVLIRRHGLASPRASAIIDVDAPAEAETSILDHHAFLLALLRLHIAIIIGEVLGKGLLALGIHMPLYVTCLLAGILLGNAKFRLAPSVDWPKSDAWLTLIAYISLGLFYTMTIMNLQLWTAGAFFSFITVNIVVQAALAAAFSYAVVFRALGRSYDAAIISAGFVGIALGSTATTLAIMTAVCSKYGRSHAPFVIVPLACGIFIDIINSALIALFAALVA